MKNTEEKKTKTTKTKKQENKTTTKKQSPKTETKKKVTPKKESVKVEKIEENNIIVEEIIKEETKKVETPKTSKKIKTSDMILILGLIVVAILGYLVMKGEKVEPSYELPLTLTGEVGLHQLTYDEYQEKIDNDESFVIIIERATCSHCVTYMPIAKSFAEDYNVPMYYVDTDTFSQEDWEGFEKSNTYFKKNKQWGTPTTIVLAGNEAVDYIEGTTTAERLDDLYNDYFDMTQE